MRTDSDDVVTVEWKWGLRCVDEVEPRTDLQFREMTATELKEGNCGGSGCYCQSLSRRRLTSRPDRHPYTGHVPQLAARAVRGRRCTLRARGSRVAPRRSRPRPLRDGGQRVRARFAHSRRRAGWGLHPCARAAHAHPHAQPRHSPPLRRRLDRLHVRPAPRGRDCNYGREQGIQ